MTIMTIDELLKENANILQRMKAEDDRFDIRRLAHEYWIWNITPPAEYYYNVTEYIKCHPEEFKSADPQ